MILRHMNGRPFPRFGGPDGGTPWVHDLFALLFIVVIVAGIIILVRMLRRPAGPHAAPQGNWTAVHELDVRYARGEVDRNEYLRRRADLLDPNVHLQPLDAPPETTPKK